MAKNKTSKAKKTYAPQFDTTLPQNIMPFGEHVEENKNIYILQSTYKEIHRFTKDKTANESGGVILGKVIEEFGKTNIVIYAFIEAKYNEGTPTTLKFTHETWKYIHKEADKKYPNLKILGWIHTHPNFGIFLSEYDKFIQQNFFSEENQIAYVVDPIQNIEGFYFWINGKIERCNGFFVFDKTGVKITVSDEKKKAEEIKEQQMSTYWKVGNEVLAAITVILIFVCVSMSKKINTLESQQKTLTNSTNQALTTMQQQISSLQSKIDELTKSTAEITGDNSSEEQTDNQSNTTSSSETQNVSSEATLKEGSTNE